MPRLTLRTLLAYIDDTLEPHQARALGQKVANSDEARVLIERIKKVTRRRGLTAPTTHGDEHSVSDPNMVAAYLSDNLDGPHLRELEENCLDSDVHLAEVAACHQILTLVLTTPVRVPPSANQRMYQIVEAPAGDPSGRPGNIIPVGGVRPAAPVHAEADDPDAALLLGMKRYAASDSWAGRIGLVGAVGAVAGSLALAVLMALPHRQPAPPDTSVASYASVPTPTPTPTPNGSGSSTIPDPKPVDAKPIDPKPVDPKKDPDLGTKKPEDPPKVDPKKEPDPKADPGPKLNDPVKPPLNGDEQIGEMKTENVIILSREPAPRSNWLRIDPLNGAVRASNTIMALPGYKADVKLKSGVSVYLWGNVPEQVAMKAMVMQSRVRFHPPPEGFAADITLESGRIYLKSTKAGAKIRLRIVSEVWDVTLKDEKSDVCAQVSTAFIPGTAYAREGGIKPKTEICLAVVAGTAELNVPSRFKKIEGITAGNQIEWDNQVSTLSGKKPLRGDLFPDRLPALEAEYGKALQRVLSDAAKNLDDPEGVRVLLKERLSAPPPDAFFRGGLTALQVLGIAFPTQWAEYSQAAIMDGPDTPEMLKDMIDDLSDRVRWYARQSAVIATSFWIAQTPGNTNLFVKAMLGKGWRDDDADLIAHLLRGYSSAATGDTAAVDFLVGLLDHDHATVREAALGNLLAFFDPEAAMVPELRIDVAVRKEPGAEKAYESFLKAWKARAEVIKKKMMAEKK
jgi:hypothetical protein